MTDRTKKEAVNQLRSITKSLDEVIDSVKGHGYSQYAEDQLSLVNKKIEIYTAQFSASCSVIKELKLNASKLAVNLEEQKLASDLL